MVRSTFLHHWLVTDAAADPVDGVQFGFTTHCSVGMLESRICHFHPTTMIFFFLSLEVIKPGLLLLFFDAIVSA